jgi:hypothetical protein
MAVDTIKWLELPGTALKADWKLEKVVTLQSLVSSHF